VVLNPGEWFVGDARHRVRTLLGSCVSVTLWQPQRRVGAMSHFVLPTRGGPRGLALEGRFGDEALALMIDRLERRGIEPRTCEAKLFGGGNMFPGQIRDSDVAVGRKNGEAARSLVENAGLRIVSSNLYGAGHRQIVFDMSTGDVWVRHVSMPPAKEEAR